MKTVDELRATSQSHKIFSVPEAVSRVRDGNILNLAPLCGGLPPDLAWPYLQRVGEVVLPQAAAETASATSEGDSGGALHELMSKART